MFTINGGYFVMSQKFEDILRQKLDATESQPRQDLWDSIEQDLSEEIFRSQICEKLDDAQIKDPSFQVWQNIDAQLHPVSSFRFMPYTIWWAAASLILIAGFWFFLQKTNSPSPENSTWATTELPKDPISPKVNQQLSKSETPELPELAEIKIENKSESLSIQHSAEPGNEALSSVRIPVELVKTPPDLFAHTEIDSTPNSSVLEELQFANVPDSAISPIINPVIIPEYSPAIAMELSAQKERPGSETALNYFFTKILGLPNANVAIEQMAKGEKNVWKVQFDSRLLSFSGNLPSGKRAE
jgi:hypothetical protein